MKFFFIDDKPCRGIDLGKKLIYDEIKKLDENNIFVKYPFSNIENQNPS